MNKVQVDQVWLDQITEGMDAVLTNLGDVRLQALSMKALLDDARLREQAVRMVHRRWKTSLGVCCSECRDMGGSLVAWPCDTISALGVDDNGNE